MASSFCLVSAISLLVLINRKPHCGTARFDSEYLLFVGAMPLLSPICWSHYFVVLLLPLAVLANRALRRGATVCTVLGLLGLILVLGLPDDYVFNVVPFVAHHVSGRLSIAVSMLPSLALLGMIIWIASFTRASLEETRISDFDRVETVESAEKCLK